MKAVLDTSVIVAALRSRLGASNALLQLVWLRKLEILVTPALFLEYEEVISRDEHCAVHQMPPARINQFLTGLAAIITPVRVYYQWRPLMQDADDEMVLESALNGAASMIVTHNIKDFLPAALRFGLQVSTPAEAVIEVRR